MQKLWESLVRFRTWLFNGIGALVILILPLLGAPEVMAVIPPEHQKWVIAAAFIINLWMRPRPAVIAKDVAK
jgi:hypothetical protein